VDLLKALSVSDRTSAERDCLRGMAQLLSDSGAVTSPEAISHCLRHLSALKHDAPASDTAPWLSLVASGLDHCSDTYWTPTDIETALSGFCSQAPPASLRNTSFQTLALRIGNPPPDPALPTSKRRLTWPAFCSTVKGFRHMDSSHPEIRSLLTAVLTRAPSLGSRDLKVSLQSSLDLLEGMSSMNPHHLPVQSLFSFYLRAQTVSPPLGTLSFDQLQAAFAAMSNKPLHHCTVDVYHSLHSHLCRCLERMQETELSADSLSVLLSGLTACDETHPLTNELFALIASYLPSGPSGPLDEPSLLRFARFLSGRTLVGTSVAASLPPAALAAGQRGTDVHLMRVLSLVCASLKDDHRASTVHSGDIYSTSLSSALSRG
jgi:hypothetical protein